MVARKICIIGLEDYPMLVGSAEGYIGGESVQHVLLARAWRDLGHEVSIVVYDSGQPRIVDVDGVKAVSACRENGGVRGVRFFTRIHSVIRAMREADADVYYQSPANVFTGVTAWFAKRRDTLSVARIASDLACIPDAQRLKYERERRLYEYGLHNATLIAAQTEHQRRLLRSNFGLDSEVVSMLVEIPEQLSARTRSIDVLWVGNLRPVKRPELVFDLARRLPQYRFVIAGGPLPRQQAYYERVLSESRALPNVRMLGPTPYAQVNELFEQAAVHLNTSSAEGFPNTFLQAWARSVPVVSFFDPDGLIRQCALGRSVSSVHEAASALDALLRNTHEREALGENGRSYVQTSYSPRSIAQRYLDLLEEAQSAGAATRVSAGVGAGVAAARRVETMTAPRRGQSPLRRVER